MKLLSLSIKNFKGLKSWNHDFDGKNATISGQNGTGKTSVFDAFLYVLFGKDSTGRTAFDIRPHDANQNPIQGLVLSVEAKFDIDGVIHTLKKEHREKIVKSTITGFENFCWINDVPTPIGKYNKWISEIIPEETFKMLADLSHFNDDKKNHWTKRRDLLLQIAGDTGTPDGFHELIEAMAGRSVDDYKKVLSERKKGYKKEADEIPSRIDEITKGLDEFDGEDIGQLQADRESIKDQIANITVKRLDIGQTESDRNLRIDGVNQLNINKIRRESELENDTSAITSYLEEKRNIEVALSDQAAKVVQFEKQISSQSTCIELCQGELLHATKTRDGIVKEHEACKNTDESLTRCPTCSQKMPADKLAELMDKKESTLSEIAGRGKEAFDRIKKCGKDIKAGIQKLAELQTLQEQEQINLDNSTEASRERIEKLNELIKTGRPENVDFTKDEKWQEIANQITQLEAEIGDPVSDQIATIDSEKDIKLDEQADINSKLANYDTAKKSRTRISKLSDREKELGQKITEIDGELSEIEGYKTSQNKLIEQAVNGMFKHTTFRLFKTNINGSVEDDCTAIYKGTPYPDCSTGEKIIIGIDIANVLSKHFKVSVPLFIDNSESLTMPIESDSQIIKLCADKKATKLIVEGE